MRLGWITTCRPKIPSNYDATKTLLKLEQFNNSPTRVHVAFMDMFRRIQSDKRVDAWRQMPKHGCSSLSKAGKPDADEKTNSLPQRLITKERQTSCFMSAAMSSGIKSHANEFGVSCKSTTPLRIDTSPAMAQHGTQVTQQAKIGFHDGARSSKFMTNQIELPKPQDVMRSAMPTINDQTRIANT
eukprot:TRINITY_DN58414_c0_g1_i1.p1 TRINITY_DN58414_c0_g1~~TRINITY_DN58414_c0_g1_i1.p1  ORF type:complete len:185 (+),score=21.93 TRINITY_DN58414_c0_g1_i1:155-709(+)